MTSLLTRDEGTRLRAVKKGDRLPQDVSEDPHCAGDRSALADARRNTTAKDRDAGVGDGGDGDDRGQLY